MRRYLPHFAAGALGILMLAAILIRFSRSSDEPAGNPKSTYRPLTATSGRPEDDLRIVRRRPPPSSDRYRVVDGSLTWSQAKQRCEDLGGHLATIMTEEENNYVTSLLSSKADRALVFWIGLTSGRKKGQWTWVTGAEPKFMVWPEGQAKNGGGNGNFAAITSSPNKPMHGRWMDFDSDQRAYETVAGFVCEWEEAVPPLGKTPEGAAAFGNHRYAFFKDRATWFWAKARCEEMGGHLVAISTKEENDFIASLLPKERDYETYYWIGVADESRKRSWRWITGEGCEYQNWRLGEPNNAGGNEDYVAMTSSPANTLHGTWNDLEGPHRTHDIVVGFICEWDAPQPGVGKKHRDKPPDVVVRTGPPVPLHSFNGHRYALLTELLTWAQAKLKCEELGGHLLTIESKEEWDFVVSRVLPALQRQEFYWIGLTSKDKPGDWRWLNGAKPDYLKWLPGEPNNFGGNEHYSAILATPEQMAHGCINDLEGPDRVHDIVVGYVCELEK